MNTHNLIPEELRKRPQWILWQSQPTGNGSPGKVPVSARRTVLRPCSAHDTQNWMTFEEATQSLERWNQKGVQLNFGFVPTENDPIVCVDLDSCYVTDIGLLMPWAKRIIDFLQTYTEVSPSGTGLKCFAFTRDATYLHASCEIKEPPTSSKQPAIEVFSAGQFVAVTGCQYGSGNIEDRTSQVQQLVKDYGLGSAKSKATEDFRDNPAADEETVKAAREFLETTEGAVSGCGGQNATFAVACRLMIDFALSLGQALDLMKVWNEKCVPPWRLRDVIRKLEDAGSLPKKRGLLSPTVINGGMVKIVEAYQQSQPVSNPEPRPMDHDGFVPFPVELLPRPLRKFVDAATTSIGCDSSFVVLPVLSTCAAAIGNARKLVLKDGWLAPCILWCAVVGESGTQKSPAFKKAYKPLLKRQIQLAKRFNEQNAAFRAAEAELKKQGNGRSSAAAEMPNERTPPIRERCLVSDTTVEALALVLRDNPRGVLLARDELAGWINSFDKYSKKGATSSDVNHWLSIYHGEGIIVDRKTGDDRAVFVPHPALSVCGGIQPGILHRSIGSEHRENGLLSRLLIAYPPRRQKKWTNEIISEAVEAEYDSLIGRLFSLEGTIIDQDFTSTLIRLSPEATAILEEYVNTNGAEQFQLTGDLAAAWSKLEEVPARLALVIHCVRQVSGDTVNPLVCDAESMRIGIKIGNWFKNETRRVYQRLTESAGERQNRELYEFIVKKGGRVRVRDVLTGMRSVDTAKTAQAQLQALVGAGFGKWEQSQNTSGPPAPEFVLFT